MPGGHGDQRVGFFHPGGQDTARTLEVQGFTALADVIGEHGAGDTVSTEGRNLLAVDAQTQRLALIDPRAGTQLRG